MKILSERAVRCNEYHVALVHISSTKDNGGYSCVDVHLPYSILLIPSWTHGVTSCSSNSLCSGGHIRPKTPLTDHPRGKSAGTSLEFPLVAWWLKHNQRSSIFPTSRRQLLLPCWSSSPWWHPAVHQLLDHGGVPPAITFLFNMF